MYKIKQKLLTIFKDSFTFAAIKQQIAPDGLL